jgi:pimeloyl-ACP methyl ester carboxylesterase
MKVEHLKSYFGALLCALAALTAASALAADAKEEAVTLETPTGKLSGTLLLPASPAKVPVALLIPGSGPTDRDGNSAVTSLHTDYLKKLAQALADAGVASLRFDKRGVAASFSTTLREQDMTVDKEIDDASAWASKLKADPRFDPLIVIGHSEGSLLGMVAAQRNNAAAFISISGAGERASDILRKQLAGKLPPALRVDNERILSAMEHGEVPAGIPPPLATLYRPSVLPYLISWFRYMPTQSIKALEMPVLIIQGDNDLQVGIEQAQALKAARPDATLAIIPGMNHVLKAVPADPQQNLASYANPALPLAPQLAPAITGFLHASHVLPN